MNASQGAVATLLGQAHDLRPQHKTYPELKRPTWTSQALNYALNFVCTFVVHSVSSMICGTLAMDVPIGLQPRRQIKVIAHRPI